MEVLRNMLMAIAALTLISGAAELLVSGGGVRAFARFACGLLLMLAMLAPLHLLLSIEPADLMQSAQETMLRAESIHADGALLTDRIQATVDASGTKAEVTSLTQADGKLRKVELLLLEGDPEAARTAVCAAFGIGEEQVVFR